MREIKFRAWDEIIDEMVDWDTIRLDFDSWLEDDDYCHLMQYTELKDKNGKEIYEGDILEYWFDSINPFIPWLTSRSYLVNNLPYPKENYKKSGTKFIEKVIYKDGTFLLSDGKVEIYLNIHCHNAKIIGNIYENPKLLD